MNKNQDKGFTLVELLIVIVILGILATVTVFAVRGITERGQENACGVEVRALETAVEAFYVDNDQAFPATLAELESGTTKYVKTAPDPLVWTYDATTGEVSGTAGAKCDGA